MRALVVVAVLASVLGIGLDGSAVAGPAAAQLAWRGCTEPSLQGLDCASFAVPRDYGRPELGSFDLAVVRGRATGSARERIGTLFFNPGGPGYASLPIARQVVAGMPDPIRRRFDVVLWDPRGVGASSGLDCAGGTFRLPATGEVDWAAVDAGMRRAQALANAACAARYPGVVGHIGTHATVRDLDALRAAVGDAKLTYWGTSYGTRIGYVYAHDHPGKVRAMLLTSPVDPNGTWSDFAFRSALAPDNALGVAFEAFPGTQERYLRSARALDARSLRLPSGAEFTRWFFRGTLSALSVAESHYADLAAFVGNVDTALHGSGAAQAAALAALDALGPPPDEMEINGGATAFVGCSDYGAKPSAQEQGNLAARARAQAPITGWLAAQGLYYCEGIAVAPDPVPVDFVDWDTPLLIMGSTRDSLASYSWVTDMARSFRNSRVVTYVGATHTPFLAGSRCVDDHGVDYLVHLRRPAVDASCPNTLPEGRRRER